MLQHAVGEYGVKAAWKERQVARVAANELGIETHFHCEAFCCEHSPQARVYADCLVTGLRGRNRPASPIASDIEEKAFPFDREYRYRWGPPFGAGIRTT